MLLRAHWVNAHAEFVNEFAARQTTFEFFWLELCRTSWNFRTCRSSQCGLARPEAPVKRRIGRSEWRRVPAEIRMKIRCGEIQIKIHKETNQLARLIGRLTGEFSHTPQSCDASLLLQWPVHLPRRQRRRTVCSAATTASIGHSSPPVCSASRAINACEAPRSL